MANTVNECCTLNASTRERAASDLQWCSSETASLYWHSTPRGQSSIPLWSCHPSAYQDRQGVSVSLKCPNLGPKTWKLSLSLCCCKLCVCVVREDMERAVQSGDWREVREFYLTTFDSFIEINAAFKVGYINTHTQSGSQQHACFNKVAWDAVKISPDAVTGLRWENFFLMLSPSLSFLIFFPCCFVLTQREANGSFNTIDDSGVNAKFVNAVYDALLSTVSTCSLWHKTAPTKRHIQIRVQGDGVFISPSFHHDDVMLLWNISGLKFKLLAPNLWMFAKDDLFI